MQYTSLYFKSIKQIRDLNRDVVLFGAGKLSRDLISQLGDKILGIVDNNPNMIGLMEAGFKVQNPTFFLSESYKKPFFVICTTSFADVGEQLKTHGLTVGNDFCASPSLSGLLPALRLESLKRKLLFTSGFRPSDRKDSGGGLYLLDIDGLDFAYRKVHSGTCHGLLKKDGLIYCVDQAKGFLVFNEDLELMETHEIAHGLRPHGIDWCNATGEYFVAASRRDCVVIFDEVFKEVERIHLSDKFKQANAPVHHINDLCVVGSSVYATMFSITGNYQKDIFDGGILELDATSRKVLGPVMDNLWMPHNPKYLNGGICVCDSLPGYLRRNNGQIAGNFPAFTRGLACDDDFYYVGQSRNRNFSNAVGISKNISLDASIIAFDDETKLSRSMPLSPRMSEVHAIEVLS